MTKDLPIDERTKEMLDRKFGKPSEKDRYREFSQSYVCRGVGKGIVKIGREIPMHNVRTGNGTTSFSIKFTKDGWV